MSEFLTLHDEPEGLQRPIIIMAFSGWNDAAESATTAARYLSQLWTSRPFASIDPESFYHFGLSRPYVRFKPGSRTEREIIWPATEFTVSRPAGLERDVVVGVAIEPHLKWRTYCATVLELARRSRASLVLTLGALLAEVAHTKPIRLVGSSYDHELSARLGLRPTRYEGPTGIVGVLNTLCREASVPTASLWANVPHYVSGIENPRAALALVARVLSLLNTEADLSDLREAAEQFDQNLSSIVSQNAKIAEYVRKLERKGPDEDDAPDASAEDAPAKDELPPSADLVAEIEQFLRQQRPESS
ncbi:MAG TPA: PAC2 family protein [Candidatus Bathyarchaeia archaeon]|nr:PAC2 family protein [Candidatus Bathyarchaeia archaeon]